MYGGTNENNSSNLARARTACTSMSSAQQVMRMRACQWQSGSTVIPWNFCFSQKFANIFRWWIPTRRYPRSAIQCLVHCPKLRRHWQTHYWGEHCIPTGCYGLHEQRGGCKRRVHEPGPKRPTTWPPLDPRKYRRIWRYDRKLDFK